MLDKFIESLTPEQKMALIQSLTEGMGVEPEQQPEPVVKEQPKRTPVKSDRDVDLDFRVVKDQDRTKTRMPVTETQRFNSFTDDGTEAKGEEFETPDVQPTERRRPPAQKVKQKCTKCGNEVSVHPTHARDWFTCDKCIGVR